MKNGIQTVNRKKIISVLLLSLLVLVLAFALSACGKEKAKDEPKKEPALKDGTYEAVFKTDSNMFALNETKDGKGILTVKDGKMSIHISLKSEHIVNLFLGTAEDAQKDGAKLLEPTKDPITYPDGLTEVVNGYDVPVEELDKDFDLAIIGTKGKWYDHKVSVSEPVPVQETEQKPTADKIDAEDGNYTIAVKLEGGTGKASIKSPCNLAVKDGVATATVIWSSDKYDYMKIGDQKLDPTTLEGGSTFAVPVAAFDKPLDVVADTTAMSTPHEIEYTLTFDSATLTPAE